MKSIIVIAIGFLLHFSMIAQNRAQVPYSMNFENHTYFFELDNWTVERESSGGYNEIINTDDSYYSAADAYEGTSSLMIWSDIIPGIGYGVLHVIMDATLKIDLSGDDVIFLKGAWKGIYQEEGMYCIQDVSDFIDDENEGIFISDDDGETYVKIMGFSGFGEWNEYDINLHRLSKQHGFQLNDKNRIKFQYHCAWGEEELTGCSFRKYLFIDDISVYKVPGDTGNGEDGYKVVFLYDKAGNRTGHYVEILLENKSASRNDENPDPFKEYNGEDEVFVYPNPTKGEIYIGIQGDKDEINYQYNFFNLQGKLLLNGRIEAYGKFPLSMNRLEPGMYILLLKSSQKELRYKIIKE
ncbi:T9SS type A sorting domain-containing protein [Anaerophaga thermohalophila]|uniref:T9SS type A sorting domain-containing protein n=1 Tax=Anaerophaga thermohalophila TaxID=177400 RepID=UPI0009E449DD|nr:T9SS type A sorting domain-containing protein [Anaerophaga thermohalophila]